MLVPQLRFPEFTDEWHLKRLGDISKIKTGPFGSTLHEEDYASEGTPIITVENLENGVVRRRRSTPLVSDTDRLRLKTYWLKEGDIVFSRVGSVDRSAYVTSESDGWLFSGRLLRVRPKVSSKYLNTYLQHDTVKNSIRNLAVGGTMPSLNTQLLGFVEVSFPSKPEQEKIADFLTAVDERIAVGEKKLELLETYKRGVMQKIFSQQIRFKDENGKLYPAWGEKKAGMLFTNISNRKHNSDLPVLSITQDGGVMRRDSLGRKIDQSDAGVKNYKIIEPNDFVISLRSFQGGIEMSTILGISSPAYTVLRGSSEIVPAMFRHYFKRDEFISKLNSTVIGIRDGKQISYEPFSTIKLPVPYIGEQQKIADFLTSLDEIITAEKSKLSATRQFKKALLQRMFV